MATAQTPGLTGETSPEGEDRARTRRLSEHFAQVSARYRTLRELDLDAVRLISEVVARGAEPGRPVRLLDVATGSGRYLDAVSQCLAAALAVEVVPIGLDLSPAMLTQARIRNGHTGLRARHLVGSVETLPLRTSSCDVMTCFNAVHHVDLARFAGEASRVLTPAGQLVVYTRTPEQNRRTIWGHHFPEFATRETRLHAVEDLRSALLATGAFTSVRSQTVAWTVTTSLSRLVDQATHYHYSTFRLYADDALRAAIDTFRQRVRQAFRDLTHITYDNDHVLVMAQRDGM
jgi:ubiquinone/menaquinone biosynthesis C-methylase UbiE